MADHKAVSQLCVAVHCGREVNGGCGLCPVWKGDGHLAISCLAKIRSLPPPKPPSKHSRKSSKEELKMSSLTFFEKVIFGVVLTVAAYTFASAGVVILGAMG